MKQLIEDYERRLKTVMAELEKGGNDLTINRLGTKASCYRTFLTELNRALTIQRVSSCYAIFDEEDNIVQLYQTEDKANKGMEEFKRSHKHTEFYVDTMQIN